MKKGIILPIVLGFFLMYSCSGEEKKSIDKTVEIQEEKIEEQIEEKPEELVKETIEESTEPIATLSNVGVGTIKELVLPETIDDAMAKKGKTLYTDKGCTACHNPTMVIIGPAPKGIFERRNPAWIMNMIMDPEKMQKEDLDAMALLKEYNNVAMTNQDVSEEEARAIVEYFRTL